MGIADWIEKHELICPVKALTGIDCPGCGMQRSLVFLLKGKIGESLAIYPALIPFFLLMLILILHLIFKFRKGAHILKYGYISVVAIILVSYIIHLSCQ